MKIDKETDSKKHSISLVGLMGAGKSAIGRRLAKKLDLQFVDTDEEIEKAAGLSIQNIFDIHGEIAFREGERKVIRRILQNPGCIIATGGGAFIDPEIRGLLKKYTTSVWLRADVEILLPRVALRKNRPLLKNRDHKEVLEKLIKDRYDIYAKADVIVDSEDLSHESMLERVTDSLSKSKTFCNLKSQGMA